ncbi:MAG: hypothetical protein QM569_01070 [Acidovorax sp.]|uniref:hypothetical protein n=1 Tax=Acidovorax sp. TaxID=1872122 RepID=UPI0039E24276
MPQDKLQQPELPALTRAQRESMEANVQRLRALREAEKQRLLQEQQRQQRSNG